MSERAERPDRPAIPASLFALVSVIVVERAVLRDGRPWFEGAPFRIVAVLVALFVVYAIMGRLLRWPVPRWLLVVCVALACSAVLASLSLSRGELLSASLGSRSVSTCGFETLSDPRESSSGYRVRARATCADGRSGDVWITLPQAVDRGSVVSGIGRFSRNGDDEWGVSSRMQGIWGSVRLLRVASCERPNGFIGAMGQLRSDVLSILHPQESEARALLAGCVCGSRDGLASLGLDKLFSRCGVAHLVAVSGGHLAIVMGVVATLLGALHLRPALRLTLIVVACGMFVLFCGAPLSAVRAWLMLAASSLGKVLGRRPHSLSSASLVGLAMALRDPCVSGQLGFLLSVMTVCGLGAFSAYAEYALAVVFDGVRVPRFLPRPLARRATTVIRTLRSCLAATLVAQMVTLPLVADTFGGVSLVGPLANMLVSTPFSAFVTLGLAAVATAGIPVVGGVFLGASDCLGGVVVGLLRLVDGIPMGYVMLGVESVWLWLFSLASMLAILLLWPRVRRRTVLAAVSMLAVVAVACLVRWRWFAPPRVCVLDVGQGDAILVQHGSHAILVDAGPDDAVVRALERNHVLHLDAVLVTHLHDDHYAGVEHLAGVVSCDEVIVGEGAAANLPSDLATSVEGLTGKHVKEVGYGDVLVVGGYRLRVISPTAERPGTENPDSVELALTYEEGHERMSGLLTGDAEKDETGAAIDRGDIGDIDFLKVGHHGSAVSIGQEQARAIDPEVAVASAGEGNRYGHPTQACIDAVEAAGCTFLCTKDVGDVELRPGDRGVTVSTQRAA